MKKMLMALAVVASLLAGFSWAAQSLANAPAQDASQPQHDASGSQPSVAPSNSGGSY